MLIHVVNIYSHIAQSVTVSLLCFSHHMGVLSMKAFSQFVPNP